MFMIKHFISSPCLSKMYLCIGILFLLCLTKNNDHFCLASPNDDPLTQTQSSSSSHANSKSSNPPGIEDESEYYYDTYYGDDYEYNSQPAKNKDFVQQNQFSATTLDSLPSTGDRISFTPRPKSFKEANSTTWSSWRVDEQRQATPDLNLKSKPGIGIRRLTKTHFPSFQQIEFQRRPQIEEIFNQLPSLNERSAGAKILPQKGWQPIFNVLLPTPAPQLQTQLPSKADPHVNVYRNNTLLTNFETIPLNFGQEAYREVRQINKEDTKNILLKKVSDAIKRASECGLNLEKLIFELLEASSSEQIDVLNNLKLEDEPSFGSRSPKKIIHRNQNANVESSLNEKIQQHKSQIKVPIQNKIKSDFTSSSKGKRVLFSGDDISRNTGIDGKQTTQLNKQFLNFPRFQKAVQNTKKFGRNDRHISSSSNNDNPFNDHKELEITLPAVDKEQVVSKITNKQRKPKSSLNQRFQKNLDEIKHNQQRLNVRKFKKQVINNVKQKRKLFQNERENVAKPAVENRKSNDRIAVKQNLNEELVQPVSNLREVSSRVDGRNNKKVDKNIRLPKNVIVSAKKGEKSRGTFSIEQFLERYPEVRRVSSRFGSAAKDTKSKTNRNISSKKKTNFDDNKKGKLRRKEGKRVQNVNVIRSGRKRTEINSKQSKEKFLNENKRREQLKKLAVTQRLPQRQRSDREFKEQRNPPITTIRPKLPENIKQNFVLDNGPHPNVIKNNLEFSEKKSINSSTKNEKLDNEDSDYNGLSDQDYNYLYYEDYYDELVPKHHRFIELEQKLRTSKTLTQKSPKPNKFDSIIKNPNSIRHKERKHKDTTQVKQVVFRQEDEVLPNFPSNDAEEISAVVDIELGKSSNSHEPKKNEFKNTKQRIPKTQNKQLQSLQAPNQKSVFSSFNSKEPASVSGPFGYTNKGTFFTDKHVSGFPQKIDIIYKGFVWSMNVHYENEGKISHGGVHTILRNKVNVESVVLDQSDYIVRVTGRASPYNINRLTFYTAKGKVYGPWGDRQSEESVDFDEHAPEGHGLAYFSGTIDFGVPLRSIAFHWKPR